MSTFLTAFSRPSFSQKIKVFLSFLPSFSLSLSPAGGKSPHLFPKNRERSLFFGKAESLPPAAEYFPPDDVERDRSFKRKRLYKRRTEGSRKKGGDKGKRAKNIPATLKGTGKSKNGALKRRKVKNCLRQRGFLISREMARSIINFFKSPTIKKRKTIVQRQKGQEFQKKTKSFERKTGRSAQRRGMKTGGKIVRREEKSAKNTPIMSK
ncbi:MAG TPA: hypothetical protein H9741_01800 [Candidatus Borkfalkia faecipullorum]|uniref:Uncharacterized protein n=1 Tax=Candidatus Borkfalkia faecipullorum TaxID=2838510 RepID=A0A9D1V6S8_9FIRM|nr:hypothetical protein [Candidatus Borkfalkia faecipullorum]